MATSRQIEYVRSLQKQLEDNSYTDKQLEDMSHQEVSDVIGTLKKEVSDLELYDELMSCGLPNQD